MVDKKTQKGADGIVLKQFLIISNFELKEVLEK